jgi:hypothetical protein
MVVAVTRPYRGSRDLGPRTRSRRPGRHAASRSCDRRRWAWAVVRVERTIRRAGPSRAPDHGVDGPAGGEADRIARGDEGAAALSSRRGPARRTAAINLTGTMT